MNTDKILVLRILAVGTFLISIFGVIIFLVGKSYKEDMIRKEALKQQAVEERQQELEENLSHKVARVQSVVERKRLVLKPGASPERIDTNGNILNWEHYKIGDEGPAILLIRFTFVNGEQSAWENIANQFFRKSQLPDCRSVEYVEFGVPKDGRTEGLEIKVTQRI